MMKESIENSIIVLANAIDDCNLCCRYCYNLKPYTHKALDLSRLFSLIRYIASATSNNITLNIEGGEPTLHPQLLSFCNQLQSICNCNAFVYTNLTKDIDYYRQLLSNNNVNIIATCHGCNKDFYNKAKDLYIEHKQKIELKVMYEDNATTQSVDMFTQLKQLNTKVDLIYVFDVNGYKARYTQDEIDRYKQLVEDEDKQYVFSIGDKLYEVGDSEINMHTSKISYKNYLCDAGIQSIYVHNDGSLFYCPEHYYEHKLPFGSLSNFKGKLFKHPIVCPCQHCPDYVDLRKTKIFNRTPHN